MQFDIQVKILGLICLSNSADQVFEKDIQQTNNKHLQTCCYLNKLFLEEYIKMKTLIFLNHLQQSCILLQLHDVCYQTQDVLNCCSNRTLISSILLGGVKKSDKDQTLLILTQAERKIESHMLSGIRTPSKPEHQPVI